MKKIENETNGKIISILGSRSDESAVRASNLNKFQMDELTISIVDGMRTFAPIADWEFVDMLDHKPQPKKCKHDRVTTEHIGMYVPLGQQSSLF